MARRLPPLHTLRAFEAAARHLSFTRAAQDLNVTQAAVSHQIKALETFFGVKLFRRFTRRLVLTEQGKLLLPVVTDILDRLAAVTERIADPAADRLLTVSVTPSFGGKWLVRRLGRFRQQHPDIDLRLHNSLEPADFAREDVDIAVRWGRGNWSGLEVEFLKGEVVAPVCSPALREGPDPLRTPEDLKHHTLLHDYDYDDWTKWLRAVGVTDVDPRRGPIMDETNVVIQAALEGQGVALGDLSLLAEDLRAGRLVRPFDISLETDYGYYIVYPRGALETPKVRAFRDFLLAEAAAEAETGLAPD